MAEAQHCNETMKLLVEEYEEIEAGFEQVRRVREIVYIPSLAHTIMIYFLSCLVKAMSANDTGRNGLKLRVEKLENTIG